MHRVKKNGAVGWYAEQRPARQDLICASATPYLRFALRAAACDANPGREKATLLLFLIRPSNPFEQEYANKKAPTREALRKEVPPFAFAISQNDWIVRENPFITEDCTMADFVEKGPCGNADPQANSLAEHMPGYPAIGCYRYLSAFSIIVSYIACVSLVSFIPMTRVFSPEVKTICSLAPV